MYHSLKLLLLGAAGVGKTTLTERYVTGKFKEDTRLTIGVQLFFKHIIFNANLIDLQIWDFGGEERFRFILPAYCIGANGAIFLYDITSRRSLASLGDWLHVVREKTFNIPILVVGTKLDLESQRSISLEDAINATAAFDLPDVIETSSMSGQNVNFAFKTISMLMIDHITQQTSEKSDVQA